MVQLLQAVARSHSLPQPTTNRPSREHTYRTAESGAWKVSLFKASINTLNDIPRRNVQHNWSNLSAPNSTYCFQFQEFKAGGGGNNPQIPRGLLVRHSRNQTPLCRNCGKKEWEKFPFPVCSLTFPRGYCLPLWGDLSQQLRGKTQTVKGCMGGEGDVKQ